MFRIDRLGPQGTGHGQAILRAESASGFFTIDGINGTKQLCFDLYSPEFRASLINPRDLRSFPLLRRSVHFRLHPDEQYSLIGRNPWTQLCDMYNPGPNQIIQHSPMGPDYLPDYDELQSRQIKNYFSRHDRKWGLLCCLRIALGNEHFEWPGDVPIFEVYLSDRIPPDTCQLGKDLLKAGIVCFDGEHTYFFPKQPPSGLPTGPA